MPQFNQSTQNYGTYVDPTFGIATLNKESEAADAKRKRTGMWLQTLRSVLAKKGLTGKVNATVDGDTGISYQDGDAGLSARDAEASIQNHTRVDNGKDGIGNTVVTDVLQNGRDEATARANKNLLQGRADSKDIRATTSSILGGTGAKTILGGESVVSKPDATNAIRDQILGFLGKKPATPPPTINPVTKALEGGLPPVHVTPVTEVSEPVKISDSMTKSSGERFSASTGGEQVGSSGNYIERTQKIDDGGTVIDNQHVSNDDLAVDALLSGASGNAGGMQAAQQMMAQNNAINSAVNQAFSRATTEATDKVAGSWNESSTTGRNEVSMGRDSSTTNHTTVDNRTSGTPNPDANKRWFLTPDEQHVDIEEKNGMLMFDGVKDGRVLVNTPELVGISNLDPEGFKGWFEKEHLTDKDEKGNPLYQLKDSSTKNPLEKDLWVRGKKVGIARKARSTGKIGDDGKLYFGKDAHGRVAGDLWNFVFSEPVSRQDMGNITHQSGLDERGLSKYNSR